MSWITKLFSNTRPCSWCQLLKQKNCCVQKLSHGRLAFPAHSLSTTSTLKASKGKSEPKPLDISENPFFTKYKSKIQHVQNTNPEEYQERIKELSENVKSKWSSPNERSTANKASQPLKVVPPSNTARSGAGMTDSKSLDSILKLDLVQDKTAQEITQIWNHYHSGKDCVFAVLKSEEYQNLVEKSKECPVFVYPLRRDDGFEFILSQFDRNEVYFTPLGIFQMVRENAPPCLSLVHYTELMQDKGIVLMNGQFDLKVLKQQAALSLVQQMSIFYGRGSKFYDIVHRFNYQPEQFQYQELIEAFKSLPQYDMN